MTRCFQILPSVSSAGLAELDQRATPSWPELNIRQGDQHFPDRNLPWRIRGRLITIIRPGYDFPNLRFRESHLQARNSGMTSSALSYDGE